MLLELGLIYYLGNKVYNNSQAKRNLNSNNPNTLNRRYGSNLGAGGGFLVGYHAATTKQSLGTYLTTTLPLLSEFDSRRY